MALHPTLDDFLDNFLEEELDRLIYQGSKLEASLHFHQVMMEELCYSIKAHDHWVHYEEYFPFSIHCKLCGSRGEKGILAHPQRPPNLNENRTFVHFSLLKLTETKLHPQNPILRMRSSTTFLC